MKKSLLVLALAFMPSVAFAKDPVLTNKACSTGSVDLTNVSVSSCSGFFVGNLLNTESGTPDADELFGLGQLVGVAGPWAAINKIDLSSGATTATFSQKMFGITVVGLHFGVGADYFKAAPEINPKQGGGTAFWVFDAGTTGVSSLTIASRLAGGSSGATLYRTSSDPCKDNPTAPGCGGGPTCNGRPGACPVPEPNSYILMASGLAGLGYLSRRRRNKA